MMSLSRAEQLVGRDVRVLTLDGHGWQRGCLVDVSRRLVGSVAEVVTYQLRGSQLTALDPRSGCFERLSEASDSSGELFGELRFRDRVCEEWFRRRFLEKI